MKEEILAELCNSGTALNAAVSSNSQKIQDIEDGLFMVDGRVGQLEADYTTLKAQNERLQSRLDDLKNRSRRQYIRVVGIPQMAEGNHPIAFMETFLVGIFCAESFPRKPEVDRAHRALRPPNSSGPPRVMITRLHHFQTKELLLWLSWERAGQLTYKGNKISIYPDYSADLARRHAAFTPAKKLLHQAGLKFSLLHPTTLRFTFNGARQEFKSPQDACSFISRSVLPAPRDTTEEIGATGNDD